MGGDIGLKSDVGVGSLFWFTVKLKKKPSNPKYSPPFENLKPKMLLIHYSNTFREMFCKYALEWGAYLDATDNITEVVSALERQNSSNLYDIVLAPTSAAKQLTRLLDKLGMRGKTKLIIYGHPIEMKEMTVDVDGYIIKPIRQLKVLELITKVTSVRMSPQSIETHRRRQSIEMQNNLKLSPSRRNDSSDSIDHKFSILLAEDNPVNQMVAVRQLEKLGYRCVVAENGKQVLELLEQTHFPLVLMDVQVGFSYYANFSNLFKDARVGWYKLHKNH